MSKQKPLRNTLHNNGYHSQIAAPGAAREEERKKIARELHDSVGQELTVLALEVNHVLSICRDLAGHAVVQDACATLERAYDRIGHLTTEVGHLSHLLHPTTLQHAGLRVALERLCAEVQNLTGLRIKCECPATFPKVRFDVSLCLYRIAQEALHNVSKHAGASTIQVVVCNRPTAIDLRIKDDGCGFDPREAQSHRGMGLTSMAERIRSLGGQFLLTTTKGQGTEIVAHLPTKEEEGQQ